MSAGADWIAGVDGCKEGWIVVMMPVGEPARAIVRVVENFAEIVDAPEAPVLVAVDMPIGLPEAITGGGRGPEQLVRPLLGQRQSSVFAIPARSAVYAVTERAVDLAAHLAGHRLAGDEASRCSTPPRRVSIQAFGIFPKIREIDALLRARPDLVERVREVHPEVAFFAMNGKTALQFPKKVKGEPIGRGLDERRALLIGAGLPAALVAHIAPKGAGADDLLDALAGLVVARELMAGRGVSYPDPPGRDGLGLPVAIWSYEPSATEGGIRAMEPSNPYADGAAYIRGRFVPIAEACLPVTDWGITRSDIVYDVVHVFKGGFFRLDDHLDRFVRSMEKRRLKPAEDRAAIEAALHRCVALTGLTDSYVAMACSRGRPRIAGSRRPADCDNHFYAYAIPWIDVIPKDVQERGAHLFIASTPRVPDASVDPTVKNYQWSDLTSGLLEAHEQNFDTAVLCDAQGFVTEGPGFNIFVVKDGRVMTPDRGSLEGITRRSVLELCAQLGVDAAIAPIPRELLEDADEVFAATTAGGVMPVARIGTRIMGNDRPGPLSMQLKDAYWKRHEEGWHRTTVRPLEGQP